MKRYPCPCCGYYTLARKPPGTYELCPVCYREDDGVQFEDPTYAGGANEPSLEQARKNSLAFRANSWQERDSVRPPREDEGPPTPTDPPTRRR